MSGKLLKLWHRKTHHLKKPVTLLAGFSFTSNKVAIFVNKNTISIYFYQLVMRQLKITHSNDNIERMSREDYSKIMPHTTCDEDTELAQKAQNGDFEALEKLAEEYFRWIEHYAKSRQNQGVELSDLIEAGQRGFVKGLENYNSKGPTFFFYVTRFITKEINDMLGVETTWETAPPRKLQKSPRVESGDSIDEILREDQIDQK